MRIGFIGLALAALLGSSCVGDGMSNGTVADLSAATANLPDTDILIGQLTSTGEGAISVVDIEKAVAGPGYQNQPAMLGPGQGRFYYVTENVSGKTDIWVYDYNTGERIQLTDTPRKSEFSPKPAPGGRLSFIQESEDGTVTRVHTIDEIGEAGDAVIDFSPVGYYEWLDNGATLAVYYRSATPALYLINVADSDARRIFEGVGRSFQPSPDGTTLYASLADKDGRHGLVQVEAASGTVQSIIALPENAQDFRLIFGDDGSPAIVLSADGGRLLAFNFDGEQKWRVAADIDAIGYGDISRIAVAMSWGETENGETFLSYGPVVFVAQLKTD
ncbi:MAG: TolB family protein [Parvularculaceae bacterium]